MGAGAAVTILLLMLLAGSCAEGWRTGACAAASRWAGLIAGLALTPSLGSALGGLLCRAVKAADGAALVRTALGWAGALAAFAVSAGIVSGVMRAVLPKTPPRLIGRIIGIPFGALRWGALVWAAGKVLAALPLLHGIGEFMGQSALWQWVAGLGQGGKFA